MGKRTFRHRTGEGVSPCPKCSNKQEFVGRSMQVAEDLCEVWIICKCGYDPTERRHGSRMEDVWGSLDPATLVGALENCWNDVLRQPETGRDDRGT